MVKENKRWYRLDNAAKIYPAVRTKKWSGNFRVSVTLKEPVDSVVLQQALDDVRERIVNFRLRLKAGFFWYYLEETDQKVLVQPDTSSPCGRIGGRYNREMPYRVKYYRNRIAVECFHALTDGTGGLNFLKTLTARYLFLKYGVDIPCEYGIVDCSAAPTEEEMEDAFKRYAQFRTTKSRSELRGYHFKGTALPDERTDVVTGVMSVAEVLKKSRSYGVSLTEFVTSIMVKAFMDCQFESKKRVLRPIKVSVPINLRNIYPSATFRNFALYVNPGIEPRYGDFTLEEIMEEIHHFMRMNNKEKYLNAIMCKNLSDEYNPFLRATPLFIKNPAMFLAFKRYGETLVSSTFSNLGAVKVPNIMADYIERFEFMLGRFMAGMPSAAAASFQDVLCITWTSGKVEKDVERRFFTTLIKLGIHVKIESNVL